MVVHKPCRMATSSLQAVSALARRRLILNRPSVSALRYSSTRLPRPGPAAVLSRPTWSVRSLMSRTNSDAQETPITVPQLHHLLRLSALPLPKDSEEEARMIAVLQSQLHFVRDIQRVDVAGVEPLRSIRDETHDGLTEATIGVEQLSQALSEEATFGHTRRPRRQKKELDPAGVEDWDALQTASRKAGRYFVVQSAKAEG